MGPHVHSGAVTPAPGPAASEGRGIRERADPLIAAVIFALFARTFLFQAFAVPSSSMEKNVLTGDRLLVNKFLFAPQSRGPLGRILPERPVRRGDVVIFRFPEDPRRDFIKRVVALPGESLEIRDKRVFVDGRPLEEPYAFHADDSVWPDDPSIAENRRRRDQLPPTRIPAGAYFVMGDNRDDSNDSRFWGPVPAGNVKGRALFVYWSVPPRSSTAPDRGGGLRSPIELLRRTRWDRAFLPVR
jgi:signal peptidase I